MKRIMLIEDNGEVSRMYKRAFEMGGLETEVMEDGASALMKLEKAESLPDAIVLDINIPSVGGREILYRVKTDDRFKKIPVVVLTNSVSETDSHEYISLGAALFLVKIQNTSKEVVEKVSALINMADNATND